VRAQHHLVQGLEQQHRVNPQTPKGPKGQLHKRNG
jgi:hypothetical protein